ncbi:MAG: NUDIX domain-containing protein [Oligosphaeraceae bacterium]|nr:NUDIX domain-containing protein [Oligosphaeraceae bacterium]
MTPHIEVCAAVVLDGSGLLLATRAPHKDLAGQWELPGGKLQRQETLAECISRELYEELRLHVEQASLFLTILHHYAHKSVRLHFLYCRLKNKEPVPQEGQKAARFANNELPWKEMVEADRKVLEFLRAAKWRSHEQVDVKSEGELPTVLNLSLAERMHAWLNS